MKYVLTPMTPQMCKPRKPRKIRGGDAWYYVDRKIADFYSSSGIRFVLTKRQIQQILAIMEGK